MDQNGDDDIARTGDQDWVREYLDAALTPAAWLYDTEGCGIILRHASGIWYSNQVGGHSCMQRAAKGFYVPCERIIGTRADGLADSLSNVLSDCEWPGVSVRSGIRSELADAVDAVLARFRMRWLRVDRNRLRISDEALMHVEVLSEQDTVFRGSSALITGQRIRFGQS